MTIASPVYQKTGCASTAASGTVQRAENRPPTAAIATAAARRIQSGGSGKISGEVVANRCGHSSHAPGTRMNEIALIASVTPSATARYRHSRRAANHARPTPGVIFVSSRKLHAAGQRKTNTRAAAMKIAMFPYQMFTKTGEYSVGRSRATARIGP